MNIRVVKVDEYQFLTCLKSGLWAANKNILRKWNVGDQIIFYVDRKIAAISDISGDSFESDDIIWDVGLFPYRIPITFTKIALPQNRLDFYSDNKLKDIFVESWGEKYGWGINCQYPLKECAANKLISLIMHMQNDIDIYKENLIDLLNEAKIERETIGTDKYKMPKIIV